MRQNKLLFGLIFVFLSGINLAQTSLQTAASELEGSTTATNFEPLQGGTPLIQNETASSYLVGGSNDPAMLMPPPPCVNSSWSWVTTVPVDNTAGPSLTDFEVMLTIDTQSFIGGGTMEPDGSDIRFTSEGDECATLCYYIESGINTASTVIWVKVPSLAAGAITNIDMYHGNGAAVSASDPECTFALHEGFDDPATAFNSSCGNPTPNVNAGALDLGWTSNGIIISDATFSSADAYTAEAMVTGASGTWPGIYWAEETSAENYAMLINSTQARISVRGGGADFCSGHNWASTLFSYTSPAGLWSITWESTGNIFGEFPTVGPITSTNSLYVKDENLKLNIGGISSGSGSIQIDWIRARKYTPNPPVNTIGATVATNLVSNPPVINCPTNIVENNDPGQCGAVVNFSDATALDPEDGAIVAVQTAGLPTGSQFPVGDSIVEFTATDSDNNSVTCQFTITVLDADAPSITCPDSITQDNDPGLCGANVTVPQPILADNCPIAIGPTPPVVVGPVTNLLGGGSLTNTPTTLIGLSNSVGGPVTLDINYVGDFGNGSECFDLTGPDGSMLLSECGIPGDCNAHTTSVSVDEATWNNWITTFGNDLTFTILPSAAVNPTLCPENNYQITATLGVATLVNDYNGTADASDFYPVGTTTVTWTVTDAGGNVSQCTMDITIEDTEAPIIECIGEPSTSDILVNGGFEDGDFTGWTVEDFTNPFVPYQVANTIDVGLGLPIANPTEGGFLATNGFDADGPDESVLYQEVTIPAGATATLSWDENIDYDLLTFCNGCDNRIYEVQIRDNANNVLETLQEVIALGGVLENDGAWESFSFDISAYEGQDIRIAFWQSVPEAFTGPARFALDNVALNVTTASAGLDVILDANGMASIPASDLIASVNEPCGSYIVTIGGGAPPVPGSLATLLAGGNGGDNGGAIYFDLTVGAEDISLNALDIHTDEPGALSMDIYGFEGTYVGNIENAAMWGAPIATASGTSAGANAATNMTLAAPVMLTAGTTYAMALVLDASHGHSYTNGDGTNQNYDNGDMSLALGSASNVPFTAPIFDPRVFNGAFYYTVGETPSFMLDLDCSNLGENLVEVTVTDDSGNVSTCMATVNVIDETAPIITCVGPTMPVETGMASDAPALDIPDNDPVGISSTLTVTEDVPITDLNVDLDIAHTWVGDLIVTIESPAGTQVTIVDRIGYTGTGFGCDEADILATLDDEAASPIEDACGTGTIAGSFTPNSPLSAFDGESTMGDWIITVSDNAGGDTGILNAWGITYTYDGIPTDAFPIYLDENGMAVVDPSDLIASEDEACGITTYAADITEFDCSDIGAPILVTVFVSDASGNIASCVAEVVVIDNLGPELTCPADQTVDPGVDNLLYEVPDYFATGEATATDNCTDPVTITSQDPAPGTLLADGVYTVTVSAEDEYGNVSTCEFELTVESQLGNGDNALDTGVSIYPNPASTQITISNASAIDLDNAMIFDINGKLVSKVNLQNMQSEKVIDVSTLAAGVYVVQINGERAATVKRLIKE